MGVREQNWEKESPIFDLTEQREIMPTEKKDTEQKRSHQSHQKGSRMETLVSLGKHKVWAAGNRI